MTKQADRDARRGSRGPWGFLALPMVLAGLAGSTAAGCNSGAMEHGGENSPMPFNAANDVEFIDAMVPHHEMATRMADMILARGASPEVRAMAQRMKDDQTREIALMRTARRELAGSETSPAHDDPHMTAEMARMMTLSGAALDAMFLEEMIPHHAGAIEMAHRALPNLQRADMRALATSIMDAQAREIGELHGMKQRAAS